MVTQEEYNVAKQRSRILYFKINLLNYKFDIVDELSGVVLEGTTFNENADSDIRRTCNLSLTPIKSSFDVADGNEIWLDKYFQVYIGIQDIRTNEVVYTNMGIYMVENPNVTYDEITNTMSIQGIDLMAKFTGLRGGNLEGMDYVIPVDSNIRESIIAVLKEAGFDKYLVDECPISVPNEIRISSGGTLYQILTELRDILPQYEMYFDEDGIFHYNIVPSGKNEQIMADNDIFGELLIGYTEAYDFDFVKNVIEVYGKTHDIKNFGGTASVEDSTYTIRLESLKKLRSNLKVGFVAPNKVTNPQLKVIGKDKDGAEIDLGTFKMQYENGDIPILADEPNKYYVVKFKIIKDDDNNIIDQYWYYMGEVSPKAIVMEENPDSPFYVNGRLGKIRKVFQGGEYDNIYTDQLALERANWELYNYCRLQDNVTITTVPIYWLHVNWLIEITLPNKYGVEKTNRYIIKSISTSGDVSGTQSIMCMKYYPYYDSE